ncbi:DUF1097 domain-containing protein [uncultured Pseudomonas sp.]|uniref:DUF1097 domain-containing protein n=1 Tax=uncultured Pseudomonas sp. TaxID=114707 RepID=UPI0025F4875A|nr:DUF1097 domain-containing protein [uncultured Pseudomonas sp.]
MRLCVSINPIKAIVGESVLACLIATLCALLIHVPVWAMFIGWITFFTRGPSAREGVVNWGCVLGGLSIGVTAGLASELMASSLGALTVIPVALGVTLLVLALKWVPVFNNVLGYFLGTVCYFASHLPPSLSTLLDLAVALSLGVIGGFLASVVNRYWSETGMRSARG